MARPNEPRYIDMSAQDQVPLSEYVAVVLHNWKTVVWIAAIVFALGLTYAFVATPIYRTDAIIQVEDPSSSTKAPLSDLAAVFDTAATAAAEVELIHSRLVIQQTVDALHLDIDATPIYFPLLGRRIARLAKSGELAKPWLGMSSFAWGGESVEVSQFDAAYDTAFTLMAGPNGTYELHNGDGNVVARGVVGQVASGMNDDQPVSIRVDRLVANAGARFVLKRSRELDAITGLQEALTIEEKAKQSGIIAVTLDGEDNAKITRIVNEVARKYVKQNVDRKKQEAQTTLAFLDDQLPKLKMKLEDAEKSYNAFRNKRGTVDLSEESRLLLGQIVDAQTKQLELEQKRSDLLQRFSDTHPAVVGLTENINELKAQQRGLAKRLAALPNTEQDALRLLRDVRVNTELYTNLLNSSQQLSIIKAGQVGNVRVVDPAMKPEKPIKPKKVVIAGISFVLGLVLGVAAPFLRRSLYAGFEDSQQIEQVLGVPVYSVVPHSDRQAKLQKGLRRGATTGQHLLAVSAPDDVAIEAMRSLRTALHFGAFDAVNNVIMVTGPRLEVGKSFLAANLAAVLASGGKRVLLVDADMRRGDANVYFDTSPTPGLSDVIAGDLSDTAIRRSVAPGLDFLPRGSKPPNPAELLMSERFTDLLDEFSHRYDIIVIDTPPVLAVTDATVIGKHAGTTLLAVRHGRHTVAEITEVECHLRNAGVEIRGVLFTDVPQRRIGYGSYCYGAQHV
jgi:tyrosine-protein kinase Etk/Wzc